MMSRRKAVRTVDLHAVIASVPMNSTAARVMSQRGEHWDSTSGFVGLHWENRPKVAPVAGLTKVHQEIAAEVIGKRTGRFVVIGPVTKEDQPKGKSASFMFVCRCDCGHFESRTRKAINNPNNSNDMCHNCRRLEQKKRTYRELGEKPIAAFTGGK